MGGDSGTDERTSEYRVPGSWNEKATNVNKDSKGSEKADPQRRGRGKNRDGYAKWTVREGKKGGKRGENPSAS